MSEPRPIATVVFAEITAPVVHAQTLPLLEELRTAGRTVDALVFASPRRLVLPGAWAAHRRAIAALARATGRRPWITSHRPRARSFESAGRQLAAELAARSLEKAVLLCRQPRAALAAIEARDILAKRGHGTPFVLLALRGIRAEEYLVSLGKTSADALDSAERVLYDAYREQEDVACRAADAVLVVSRAMERRVATRYDVDPSTIVRIPSIARVVPDAEELRRAARKRLRISDLDTVFAYAGTMAAWQMPGLSADLVQAMREHKRDVRLLFVTPETRIARAALSAAGLDGGIVRSAAPGEAHREIAAADYGLLLREDSEVNRVASPVKFGEYLACGLRPIVTACIGDISTLCQETGLGLVVPTTTAAQAAKHVQIDVDGAANLSAEGRAQRRSWAAENIAPSCAAERLTTFLDDFPTTM